MKSIEERAMEIDKIYQGDIILNISLMEIDKIYQGDIILIL